MLLIVLYNDFQVVTEQRIEVIRMQLGEEIEAPFRQKMVQLNDDSDRYRAEYNKLKYEYSFLKAEYEHEKNEHTQIIEELKLRHEAEVSSCGKKTINVTLSQVKYQNTMGLLQS